MNNIILYGAGEFAELLTYFLNDNGIEVSGYVVDTEYWNKNEFQSKKLIAFDEMEMVFPPEQYEVLIAVTAKNMNHERKRIFDSCKQKGYRIASFADRSARICSSDIGEGNIIFANVFIGPFCKIGKGNVFSEFTCIPHFNTVGDFNFFTPSVNLAGHSHVGNHCFIGLNSEVKNYVRLADYTLLGAGTYLDKDTKPYDVVVPARSAILENKKSTDIM